MHRFIKNLPCISLPYTGSSDRQDTDYDGKKKTFHGFLSYMVSELRMQARYIGVVIGCNDVFRLHFVESYRYERG
mgnify:CR=1 FL=1